MSKKRKIIAYTVTHAPLGVKGGPYESWAREAGESCRTLAGAYRASYRDKAEEVAADARDAGVKDARVVGIVRKDRARRPEVVLPAVLANTERLRVIGKNLCGMLVDIGVASREDIGAGVALQIMEINRLLPVDDRVPVPEVGAMPSEASAVEVLRKLVAEYADYRVNHETFARARAVLAAAGPDPMPVVWAAMVRRDARAAHAREDASPAPRRQARLADAWRVFVDAERAEDAAVDAYREAGGK